MIERAGSFFARGDAVPSEPLWPAPPCPGDDNVELLKLRYTAQLAEIAELRAIERKQDERAEGRLDDDLAHDRQLRTAETEAYLAIGRETIDRGRSGAEATRNAAAAIGTLYTALLGVTYTAGHGTSLPPRGVIPALFLGAAVICATAYGAMMHTEQPAVSVNSEPGLVEEQDARVHAFVLWASAIAKRNAWALHAAIYSLGVGVASMPLPFVRWPGTGPWVAAAAGLLAIVSATLLTARDALRARSGCRPNH